MKGRRKQVGARSVQLLYRVAKVWVLWLWSGVRREWCALRAERRGRRGRWRVGWVT